MKHTDIIQKLNLEQKCALLSGETVFTTRALPGKGGTLCVHSAECGAQPLPDLCRGQVKNVQTDAER